MSSLTRWIAAIGLIALLAPAPFARAQGVAFQPTIGVIPDGVGMTVAPVASADRRYVRLGVGVSFTGFVGFSTFPVPAAVGGGGIGGGFGGLPGGLGGAGGGQGALGENFNAGMNGIVNPSMPVEPYAPMTGFDPADLPYGIAVLDGQVPTPQPAAAARQTTKARLAAIEAKKTLAQAKAKTVPKAQRPGVDRDRTSTIPATTTSTKKRP